MMKIYIPYFEDDAHGLGNPYVYTLTDFIEHNHDDVRFFFSKRLLWQKECESFDVIHFMWPQIHAYEIMQGLNLARRIQDLKSKGVIIVSTCHNLKPHYFNETSALCYDIVYKHSDVIIHLGEYSLRLFENQYSFVRNLLIPHHVYNTIYGEPFDRIESRKKLGLPLSSKVALCVGDFRTRNEKQMIIEAAAKLCDNNIIVAPRLYTYAIFKKNNLVSWIKVMLKNPLVWIKIKLAGIHGLVVKGRFVKDSELMTYMGAADLVIIQRVRILNSGNLPLGMYMSKVVVGPNEGNVGDILTNTGNPVFNPHNIQSVVDAIRKGFILANNGKGIENKKWIMKSSTTEIVAEAHYNLYKSLLTK